MPNRVIREGWLDSESIGRLSAEAERFFLRLCVAMDDAGRMDGRAVMLKAKLFPAAIGITEEQIKSWLAKCVSVGLVVAYDAGGKPYVQVTRVHRSSPAVISRFPWRDGTHRIDYVKLETRDGVKDFVKTSLPDGIAMGSVCHADGIEVNSAGCTGTGTETCTDTVIAGAPARVTESKTKDPTPHQEVVLAFKIAQGAAEDDKLWDQGNFARASKTAVELIKGLGSKDEAIRAIHGVKAWADAAGLNWSIETVLKKAADWKAGRLVPEVKSGGGRQGPRVPSIPYAKDAMKAIADETARVMATPLKAEAKP